MPQEEIQEKVIEWIAIVLACSAVLGMIVSLLVSYGTTWSDLT